MKRCGVVWRKADFVVKVALWWVLRDARRFATNCSWGRVCAQYGVNCVVDVVKADHVVGVGGIGVKKAVLRFNGVGVATWGCMLVCVETCRFLRGFGVVVGCCGVVCFCLSVFLRGVF